jgi:predicted HTH transcriptional regulator
MDAETSAQRLGNISIGMSVMIQIKRLEKIMNGTITDILDKESFNLKGIEVEIDNYYFGHVKKIIQNGELISEMELREKIQKHETSTFEMKSSFKYDLELSQRLGKPTENELIKRKIVEEAAGFMNTKGGMICIGVDNNKNILGLENDYKLQKDYSIQKDRSLLEDKLRLEIKDTFHAYFDDDIIVNLFEIGIISLDGKEVCCIKIEKSPEPIFVKIPGTFHDAKLKKDLPKTKIWKCWIRSDNGLASIDFDDFMKIWN